MVLLPTAGCKVLCSVTGCHRTGGSGTSLLETGLNHTLLVCLRSQFFFLLTWCLEPGRCREALNVAFPFL